MHRDSGRITPESKECRERAFATGTAFATERPALIVVNGIDRFFDLDGTPLGAEVDLLLRCILGRGGGQVQWLVLGSDRIRRYFEALSVAVWTLDSVGFPAGARERAGELRSQYLAAIAAGSAGRPSVAGDARLQQALPTSGELRAFFAAHLEPERLTILDGEDSTPTPRQLGRTALMFEILRAQAFIGWPVEAAILRHVPKLRAMLARFAEQTSDTADDLLAAALEALHANRLLIEMLPFDAQGRSPERDPDERSSTDYLSRGRFGLHRSLATDLRQRFGIPLSEAKLANSFNMSLFAAQPGDDYKPEPHFHEELGQLVDRLLGAWRDLDTAAIPADAVSDAWIKAAIARDDDPLAATLTIPEVRRLCAPEAAACLRAALAVIRGYYSTGSLLSLDRTDKLVDPERDGALTEHADRLDRLLRVFGRMARMRELLRKQVSAEASAALGPEPLYPDDLVWLHNERGVVKLAQGDIYAAVRSFHLARGVNGDHVERDHRGHNWRRITLNLIGALIERGRLATAENRLDEIARSVDDASWMNVSTAGPSSGSRMATILRRFGDSDAPSTCQSPEFGRDEVLVAGLVASYRGLIAMHRGQERNAYEHFRPGLRVLRRLGEQRAYALFQRHYASLRRFTEPGGTPAREIQIAIEAADASGQIDLAHRARILGADEIRRDERASAAARRDALDTLRRALDYAALTDAHRVRIEAQAALGRLMLKSGDYEAALKHSADAMAVACRYGHSLQKLSLRAQIGDILIRRGDPKSGQAMLERALSGAARIGYQRIVERVQRARKNEVLSAATATINV